MTFSLAPFAQHHVQKKPAKKTAVASNKQHNRKKPAAKAPARRGKQHVRVSTKAPTKAERRAATYSNANIRGLQGQRASIQKRIREQEQESSGKDGEALRPCSLSAEQAASQAES